MVHFFLPLDAIKSELLTVKLVEQLMKTEESIEQVFWLGRHEVLDWQRRSYGEKFPRVFWPSIFRAINLLEPELFFF